MTLSDTQRTILAAAAQHEVQLATAPRSLPAAARNAVFRSMLKHGLLTEVPATQEYIGLGWRQDETDAWIALRLTDAGLQAIGEAVANSSSDLPTETMHDVQLSPSVIHKVLVRHDLNVLPRRKRVRHTPKRHSLPVPGDRIQMDVCKIRPSTWAIVAMGYSA